MRNQQHPNQSALTCLTCGKNMAVKSEENDSWVFRPGLIVGHCEGSVVAFGAQRRKAHHTPAPWPDCWSCNQPLGCRKCAASVETEVLCQRCSVWGTVSALIQHGPISNASQHVKLRRSRALELRDYPTDWQAEYRRSEEQFRESLKPPQTEQGKAVMAEMLDALKKGQPVKYEELIIAALEIKQAS